MGLSKSLKPLPTVPRVGGLFFPQRKALGLDPRESTPGFKHQLVVLNAELRSLKRAAMVTERVLGQKVSTNTIERICLDVAADVLAAEQRDWKSVITGEITAPSLAIVEFDGGRIRTRKTDCGPGVHLEASGWNETKNAIFVSALSTVSDVDPQPQPPRCFLDRDHVAKLSESTKICETSSENQRTANNEVSEVDANEIHDTAINNDAHKPRRVLRTFLSSLQSPKEFGRRMKREATRRRFDEASRKAFVGDGLPCNWKIHQTHFKDYVAVLDFVHAVTYLFDASVICFGKTDAAWSTYIDWMTRAWQSNVASVIAELRMHQQCLGEASADANADDPRERLRLTIGYLENNSDRMDYVRYRREGLPTTSAWMESAVKELNYRVKGTEMFWNNPVGAEAILCLRAATLSDDDRLTRLLKRRPGQSTLRKNLNTTQTN